MGVQTPFIPEKESAFIPGDVWIPLTSAAADVLQLRPGSGPIPGLEAGSGNVQPAWSRLQHAEGFVSAAQEKPDLKHPPSE